MQLILKPNVGGPHVIRPSHETILSGIDITKAQCLALIDVGAALGKPEFAGFRIPLVSYFVNETLRLKPSPENDRLWIQDTSKGDILEFAEPFENGATQFNSITASDQADLVLDEGGGIFDLSAVGMWFRNNMGGKPEWIQEEAHPGEGYVFVGQMESYYSQGTIYAFYHPTNKDVVLECQFS